MTDSEGMMFTPFALSKLFSAKQASKKNIILILVHVDRAVTDSTISPYAFQEKLLQGSGLKF